MPACNLSCVQVSKSLAACRIVMAESSNWHEDVIYQRHRRAMDRVAARLELSVSETDAPAPVDLLLFVKDPGSGGVERTALRLASEWRAMGLNLSVLVGSEGGRRNRGSDSLGPPPSSKAVACWRGFRLGLLALRQVRRVKPAIIFCPGNSYTILAVLLKAALGKACPPILAKISNDLERRDMPRFTRGAYRLWLRIQARMIDHFAVLSQPMASEAIRLMGVAPSRVHRVANPALSLADLEGAAAAYRPSGPGRRFVAVGRLERQKDYPTMLRAFAMAAKHDDRLTIYGDGSARPALAELARSLGLSDKIRFAGHCGEILRHLRDHDILLLSSLYEGQPAAVVEALAVGLDVIATRCCAGITELLEYGALGTLVEGGDVTAFARAVDGAVPGRQDKQRSAAKARAYTTEAAAPAYAELFAKIVAEPKRGRVVRKAARLFPVSRSADAL